MGMSCRIGATGVVCGPTIRSAPNSHRRGVLRVDDALFGGIVEGLRLLDVLRGPTRFADASAPD
jgi:hypothetical protein